MIPAPFKGAVCGTHSWLEGGSIDHYKSLNCKSLRITKNTLSK